jgi:hypothetical protein
MLFAPIVSGRSPALKNLADLSSFRGPGALPLKARKTAVQGRKIAPRASAGATAAFKAFEPAMHAGRTEHHRRAHQCPFLGAKQTRAVRFSTSAFDPFSDISDLQSSFDLAATSSK